MKEKGTDNQFSFVTVIGRFCAIIDDVYSFNSTFMNELIFSEASKIGTQALDKDVDIFSKNILLFPYSLNEHRLLFVVLNTSTQLNGHGVNNVLDERPLSIHFDSSPTGSTYKTELVACKISPG